MKQVLVFAASISLLFGASAASAQTYYSFYDSVNSGVCASLTSDLSVGSRGASVSTLQIFLVAQNYPGGGNWMITGYYGQATAAAVRIFQSQHGLAQTGIADAATRTAMCGGSYSNYGTNYNYTYNPYISPYAGGYGGTQYNYQNTYNTCGAYPYLPIGQAGFYSCYTNNSSAPVLTSLSPAYGGPGTSVTVYGTGFDSANNTVYIGGTTLRNISSYNGTALVFTMPSNISGSVSVSVGNTYGVSNALTFQTGGSPIVCGTYPYGSYGTYCPPPVYGQISINPASGAIGTSVTVYGGSFSRTNNTVHFGNGIIANLNSFDGTSLSFTVPSTISGYGYQPIGLGTYNVSVTNAAGQTSNAVPFTITSIGSGTTGAPTITSVTGPTSLAVNTQGTWTISVNNNQANSYTTTKVNWGDKNVYGASLSAEQTTYVQGNQTLTFAHTYATAGTYTVTFTVTGVNGLSNTSTVTVN